MIAAKAKVQDATIKGANEPEAQRFPARQPGAKLLIVFMLALSHLE
jgi:hypothetical protein